MELRQLRYFVSVVDHGSLSRAATKLHIAQPALTNQLNQLEDELGVHLLHRTPQGTSATERGKVFYEYAIAILRQISDAKSVVNETSEQPRGNVSLGIPQSVSAALAMPLLKAVRDKYPKISLQITEELTGNLVTELKLGRLNLAILFDDGHLGCFSTEPMVEEEIRFITRAESQFSADKPLIELADAMHRPLILPDIHHGVRPHVEKILRLRKLCMSHLVEINSIAILKSALLADMGVTLSPVAPFVAELERGMLSEHEIADAEMYRTVVVCASKAVPLTAAAEAVRRLVIDTARELCQAGEWLGTVSCDRE